MKVIHRSTLAALIAGAALIAAGAARAQDRPPGDPSAAHEGEGMSRGDARHGGWESRQGMMEKLNLTDEQSKKLDDIRYQHQKKAITMRADLEGARLDLGRLMRADTPDRRAIEAQIDKLSAARTSLEKDRVGQMLEMRAVLTPEQLKTWRSMRGGMRGMHGGMPHMMRFEPGMRGGDGGSGPGGQGESMMMGLPELDDPGLDDPDAIPAPGTPGR